MRVTLTRGYAAVVISECRGCHIYAHWLGGILLLSCRWRGHEVHKCFLWGKARRGSQDKGETLAGP